MERLRRLPFHAAAVLAACAAAAAPGTPGSSGFDGTVRRDSFAVDVRREIEADLRARAFRLWEQSGFGLDRSEHAAWIVAAAEGLAWRPWPWDRRYLQSRWMGPTPHGAVAIVHTHPAVVDPRPSVQDCETAARLGVAVYTVSRSGIWKAGPGGAVTRVGDESWWAGCKAGNPCRESVGPPFALAEAGKRPVRETTADPLRITE